MGFIVGTDRSYRKGGGRPAGAGRAVAAAGAFAVMCALPASGSPTGPGTAAAVQPLPAAASGVVGRSGGAAAAGPDVPPSSLPGTLPAAIFSDAGAPITFPRALVGTVAAQAAAAAGDGAVRTVLPTGFGRPPAGFLMAPLARLYPSSPFGFRVSPLSGQTGDFHLGQDYAAACGTTVHAADAGVVRAAGWHLWGGGNRVEIDHGNGLITTYNHLESIAVRSGDQVQAGETVARVGSTGWSTGCHLHFETILNGRHTSPSAWGLIPLQAVSGSGQPGMLSYMPGSGTPAAVANWIIPGAPVPAGLGGTPRPGAAPAGVSTTTAASPAPSGPAGEAAGEQAAAPAPMPSAPGPTTAPSAPEAAEPVGEDPEQGEPAVEEQEPAVPAVEDPEPAVPAVEDPETGEPAVEDPAPAVPAVEDPAPAEPAEPPAPEPPADEPSTEPSEPPASAEPSAPPASADPAVPTSPADPAVPTNPAGSAPEPTTPVVEAPPAPAPDDAVAVCGLETVAADELAAAVPSEEGTATNYRCEDLPED